MTVLTQPNPGKSLTIEALGNTYERYPVKTPVINTGDNFMQTISDETDGFLQDGDLVLVAESVVAISQGRGFIFSDISYGFFAKFYSQFVTRTPAGIGLGTPETMQLAINEAGFLRVSLAVAIAGITKPLGWKGNFYRVAGSKARAIDGPTAGTLPPYNEFATLSPKNPRKWAQDLEQKLNKDVEVIVVDANDIGVNILGAKDKTQNKLGQELASDNPMGQGHEGTPILVCRKV